MKYFNSKHEAIINTYQKPIEKAKEGDMCKHSQEVREVVIYIPKVVNGGYDTEFLKISLSREKILDLAKHIGDLEKQTVIREFNEYPF